MARDAKLDAKRTALYRLYDAEDRLLYLGITVNVKQRLPQHAMTKFWWHLVVRTDVEWHPNRRAAEDAERIATVTERPIYDGSYRAFNGVKYKTGMRLRDPYWRPLAVKIYREIEAGDYALGEALPDEKAIAAKYEVSTISVAAAITRLIKCRMVEWPGQRNGFRHIVRLPADRLPIEAIQEPTDGELWDQRQANVA